MVTPAAKGSRGWRIEARDVAPFLSFVALAGFFSLASPDFLELSTVNQVLNQGAVLAIVSTGLTFVLLCAEIDLSVGMMALWTACFAGVLFEQPFAAGKGGTGVVSSAAVALVLAIPLLSSLLLGLLSGLLTVWSRLPSFIITLAMMNISSGLARYLTKSEKFSIPRLLHAIGNDEIDLSLAGRTMAIPYSAILAALLMIAAHLALVHTRFGRYVMMTGGNREAARLAGVPTGRIVIACLGLSALTAGIGGLVNAGRLASVSLDQNADLLLSAVACVVLGGTSLFGGEGSIPRTLMGVVTFATLGVGLNQITWIDDLMRPFLMGAVLLAALLLNGLLSRGHDR